MQHRDATMSSAPGWNGRPGPKGELVPGNYRLELLQDGTHFEDQLPGHWLIDQCVLVGDRRRVG
jgi:hypothetical protein